MAANSRHNETFQQQVDFPQSGTTIGSKHNGTQLAPDTMGYSAGSRYNGTHRHY